MMMFGVLLPMPLFAAATPATLENPTRSDRHLEHHRDRHEQQLDGLRLGGAVGDIGSVKNIVANQGVQIVTATAGYSFFSQESVDPQCTRSWTKPTPASTSY